MKLTEKNPENDDNPAEEHPENNGGIEKVPPARVQTPKSKVVAQPETENTEKTLDPVEPISVVEENENVVVRGVRAPETSGDAMEDVMRSMMESDDFNLYEYNNA